MAMMHVAVHDVLNAIDRRNEPYLYVTKGQTAAAPDAAIAAAARDVLVGVIPSWGKPEERAKALAIVDTAYAAALAKVSNGPPKDQGIALGQAAAAAMLAARKVDGSDGAPRIHAWDGSRTVATSSQPRARESTDRRSGPRRGELASATPAMGTSNLLHDGDPVAVSPARATCSCELGIRSGL
jgi:hypothetical protein